MASSAVRKLAISSSLPILEVTVVDEVVDLILMKEGFNSPFNPKEYLYLITYSIMASIAAGKSYSIEDHEFIDLKNASEIGNKHQPYMILFETIPFMKYILYNKYTQIFESANVFLKFSSNQMDRHLKKYYETIKKNNTNENSINDFCEALIHAKIEAEKENLGSEKHLNSDNLKNVVQNFFQAGTETTRLTLEWAILLIAYYPNVQKELRNEIEIVIGNEIPRNDHRIKCHYVQSFICEVMRFSPVNPNGVAHKATIDSEIKGHRLRKGTSVIASHISQLHDLNIWGDPRIFRPERFLTDGKFNSRTNTANTPFSVGKRSCLGERLAIMNLFIIITRILQKTNGMKIMLKNDNPESVTLGFNRETPTKYGTIDHEIMIVENK